MNLFLPAPVIGRHSALIASIDDLFREALARAEGAGLTVTSSPPSLPPLSVTFALLLCLLKAEQRLQIG